MVKARISAYLTTYNCIQAGDPFVAAIQSMLGLAWEVVVADGGSFDGTWERLSRLAEANPALRLLRYPIDATAPSWALDVDLWLKAKARRACRGRVCWEADVDEIVTADDWRKVHYCIDYLTENTPLLALPVLEYWEDTARVRRDVYPATPKLSLNLPTITHGLPRGFRAHDEHGLLYALPYASLGSSYIDTETLELVACDSMIPHEIDMLREQLGRDAEYEEAFYDWLDDLPVVHNFAWVPIARRLRLLRSHWERFHRSYYRIREPVSAWPLFDNTWHLVTDADIEVRGEELATTGPGVLSGETDFPALMPAKKELPAQVRRWLRARSRDRHVRCVGFGSDGGAITLG